MKLHGNWPGLCLLALAACGPNPPTTPASLTLNPNVQDFGPVVVGTNSSTVEVTVTNPGDEAAPALATAFSGTGATQFSVVAGGCAGAALAGGAHCTLTIRFTPTALSDVSAALDVTSSDGSVHASATLTGKGIAPALLTITPASPATFATTPLGEASPSQGFTVTNTGTAPTGTLTTALGGDHPTDFPIVPNSNGCQGAILGSGRTCTIAVTFAPTAVGTRTSSLTVSAEPGNSATTTLSGSSAQPASLTLTPTGLDLNQVGVGASSATTTFTVSNGGGVPSGDLSIVITDLGALNFSLATNTCTARLAAAGQTGSSCTFTVNFKPLSVGLKNATLEVSASPGGTRRTPLAGTGITAAALALTGSPNFGSVTVGQSATTSFTVSNTGEAPTGPITMLTSGTNASEFGLVIPSGADCVPGIGLPGFPGAPASLPSCQVRVRFAPSSAAGLVNARNAALEVSASPGGGTQTLGLSANARALVTIAATPPPTPPALDGAFGSAPAGVLPSGAPTLTFTLTNNATAGGPSSGVLTVGTLGPPDANQFSVTGGTCVSGTTNLQAGVSCTLVMKFLPTSTGAKASTLSAAGTFPSSSVSLALSGTGT